MCPVFNNLDPNVEANTGGGGMVPPGKHQAFIVKSEIKPTKAGTGSVLHLYLETKGGGTLRDFINIHNPSDKAQAIGQGTLKQICLCSGVPWPPANSEVLHGRALGILVEHEDSNQMKDDGTPFKNAVVKKYMKATAVGGEAPAAQTPASSAPW